jgi:integration host factor subunit alpha
MTKPNLTRKELAQTIHERTGLPKQSAGEIVDSMFDHMRDALIALDPVKLVQFGTFNVREKAPRLGRNPRTGETMEICRRHTVSFKPSKTLRDRINE